MASITTARLKIMAKQHQPAHNRKSGGNKAQRKLALVRNAKEHSDRPVLDELRNEVHSTFGQHPIQELKGMNSSHPHSLLTGTNHGNRVHSFLQLQRAQGNSYVQRLLAESRDQIVQRQNDNNIERARFLFRRAHAHFLQAERTHDERDFRVAIILFERARQVPGLDETIRVQILYNIGLCNLNLERYATAIRYFEEYLASPMVSEPEDRAEARQRIDQARRGAGVVEEETGREYQEQIEVMWNKAINFYIHGNFRQAIILFTKIRQLPGVSEEIISACMYNIGRANFRSGRYATAIPYFEEYIANPLVSEEDRAGALTQLAEARRRAGIPAEEQEANLEQAQELFDLSAQFYRDGEWAQAIVYFERLWLIPGLSEEDRSTCAYNIGVCCLNLGRFRAAIAYFESYIRNPAVSDDDRAVAYEKLDAARRGVGLPVEEEAAVTEQ